MTWLLKDPGGVEIKAFTPSGNQPAGIANLQRSVTMTFVQLDDVGVANGNVHTYTEPSVPDVSAVNIARLAGDQLRQLNAMEAATVGQIADLSAIKLLMNQNVRTPPPMALSIKGAADFKQTDDEIAAALNAATVDNPVTVAPKVDPPMDARALLGLLDPSEVKPVMDSSQFSSISDAIGAGKNAIVGNLAFALEAIGVISPASFGKITAACAPIDDPAWTAKVSWSALNAGRDVTAADVALARAIG